MARREPQDVYAGPVEYEASNGWRLCVFNDANEWDYVEWVESADGRRYDYGDFEGDVELESYEPSQEAAWSRYGIPGYMKFRCKVCGNAIEKKEGPYVCEACAP